MWTGILLSLTVSLKMEEEGFDAMQNLSEFDSDPHFDESDEFRYIQQVVQTIVNSDQIKNHVITDYHDVVQQYIQNIIPSNNDSESYRSKLAWLPINVIKNTLK